MPASGRSGRDGLGNGAGAEHRLQIIERVPGGPLWLSGSIRGRRIRESLGTRDRGLAEEARAVREAELFRAAIYGVAEAVMFERAAASYLTTAERDAATYRNVAKLLKHFGGRTPSEAIDQAAIDGAAQAICPGAKPASVLRQVITPAKAVLNHAARRGWCEPPRFERVRGGGRRTDLILPAEAEAMLTAASEHFRPLLTFLLCTGARVGEAVNLEWADVNLRLASVNLRETKNGDDRRLDLPPRAIEALRALHAALGGPDVARVGPVFLTDKRRPYRATNDAKGGATGGQIRRAFAGCLRKAGIERVLVPHICRHTWATWHYALHHDLVRLREDGGWRTTVMCERYTKLAPAGLVPEVLAFLGLKPATARRRRSA